MKTRSDSRATSARYRRRKGCLGALGALGALVCASAVAFSTPARAQSIEPARTWYGWQNLIVYSVPTVLLGTAPLFLYAAPVGVGGIALGGPIVHFAHGHVGKGFAAFGINTGSMLVSGAIGAGIGCGAGSCNGDLGALVPIYVGACVGAIGGMAIDVALLSYEPRYPEVADGAKAPRAPQISWAPSVDIRPGRTVVGVGGMF